MSFYSFLQAQLPTLSLEVTPSITALKLAEYARDWIPSTEADLLSSLARHEWPEHPVVNDYRQFDTALRNHLVQLRAVRLNREPAGSMQGSDRPNPFIRQFVVDLTKDTNPENIEKELDLLRWQFIEQRTALDSFNFPYLIGYMLKLLIVERWAGLDAELGKQILQETLEESVREAIGNP